jgi:hypothetical protein
MAKLLEEHVVSFEFSFLANGIFFIYLSIYEILR